VPAAGVAEEIAAMPYHHILIHKDESSTQITLLFKDLSKEEVCSPFLIRFIRAAQRESAEVISVNALRATVIRTERRHDDEVSNYLIAWGEKAEEFMRQSGYPVNSQPMGDSAILGAGKDVTAEFLQTAHSSEQESVEVVASRVESIGRYQVARELEGGDTPRYEAFDPQFNRLVHVTTVCEATHRPEDYVVILNGFRRHAHVAGRLVHPGIMEAFEAGEANGVAYLATAPFTTETLKAKMQDSTAWPFPQAVDLASRLLEVLESLHSNGMVHRDVRPAGIVQEADGRVLLTDFSAVFFTDPSGPIEHEEEGTMVGTAAYMSPEQIAGERLDARSDLFAVGIVLYQLLTGRRPFVGAGGHEIINSILNDAPVLPSRLNASVPLACDAVVMKALAKDPASRFASAAEFGVALRSAVIGERELQDFIAQNASWLTSNCMECITGPYELKQMIREGREAWRRYGSGRPTHCVNCGSAIKLFPKSYACWDCGNKWEVGFTKFELQSSVDKRPDKCGRCGQRIGTGHHDCRKCGQSYEIEVSHWHVSCDTWSSECPACGENEASLCVC
jgi:serine/threonine protein kinase